MTIMAAKVVQTEDVEDNFSESNNSDHDSEADRESSENEDHSFDEGFGNANAGWADSIAKILKTKKPKGKKTLVLSKAKKLTDVKAPTTRPAGFQVATTEGEIKEEKVDVTKPTKTEEPPRKKKRDLPTLRTKPDILQRDRERTLSKIATKGVVQLFNAVKTQQKDIKQKLQEAGPLEVKKDKVLKSIDKRAFLDVLMGEKSQVVDDEQTQRPKRKAKEEPETEQTTWSVLRDDFMMGAKLKDWDKETEVEEENEADMESE